MAFPKDGPGGGKMTVANPNDGIAAGKAAATNPGDSPVAGKIAPTQKIAISSKIAATHPKDGPAVKNFKNYQVITPPNRLRRAMETANPLDGDHPVKRAEKALAQLATQFSAWMGAECERLDTARKTVVQSGLTGETRDALFHAAHDIKGQAATFGYPAVALAAESLCRLIEHRSRSCAHSHVADQPACGRGSRHRPRKCTPGCGRNRRRADQAVAQSERRISHPRERAPARLSQDYPGTAAGAGAVVLSWSLSVTPRRVDLRRRQQAGSGRRVPRRTHAPLLWPPR